MAIEPVTKLTSTMGDPAGSVLVDLSWLLHRSFYSAPDLTTMIEGVEVPVGAIHGTLNSLLAVANRRKNYTIILCVDGDSEDRKKICPGYKAGRNDTHKKEIYAAQRRSAAMACCIPGVVVAHHQSYEADDLISTFSCRLRTAGPVVIFSKDKDLTQCLRPEQGNGLHSVHMFDKLTPTGFILKGVEYPESEFGVPPDAVVMFRAIVGDTSDNLKGYSRFPKKLAARVALHFQDPEEFLSASEEARLAVGETKAQKKRIQQLVDDPAPLRRNYFVMRLKDVPQPPVYRISGGETLLAKYNLRKISQRIEMLQRLRDEHLQA